MMAGLSVMLSKPTLSSSHRRLGAEQHRHLARQRAAIAVAERDLGVLDLTRAALAAQLRRALDQREDPIHAGMDAGEAAAIGVDRQRPARRDAAARDEGAALALLAIAEILEEEEGVDG